jgi:hypothetical protein
MTPTAPGRARAFVDICLIIKGKSSIPWIGQLIFGAQPRWFTHLDAHETLDGDSMLLYFQERILSRQEGRGASWKDTYFMPTSSDMCVFGTCFSCFSCFRHKQLPGGRRARLGTVCSHAFGFLNKASEEIRRIGWTS